MTYAVLDDRFDVAVERDVMIAMRDGIRLATDIYRPARGSRPAAGRFPVILERTPYDKSAQSRSERSVSDVQPKPRAEVAAFYVRRGYIVAFQDCRGRFKSEGQFVKYLGEANDGYDTIEWLARQPWSSGKVGTMGLSYAAHTQAAAACLNPPSLACMVLDSGGFASAFRGGIRQGGAFELKQATWAYKHALMSPSVKADPLTRRALEAEDIGNWFTRMPWRAGQSPLRWAPEYEEYLLEQWTHGTFDDFWRQIGIYAEGFYDRFADVPMIHMSSWYDPYPLTATGNYTGLKALGKGPLRLILGPWTHGDRTMSQVGDVDFGPAAVLDGNLDDDFATLRLHWFDRWLKGLDNGIEREPEVRYFVMGGGSGRRNDIGLLDHGGRWKSSSTWPLPEAELRNFYLHADGSLSDAFQETGEGPLVYQFDPKNPVPTIGGAIASGAPIMEAGAFDQVEDGRFFGCKPPFLPLESRPDILVFETAPLAQDLEIAGPIVVRLWVSSDGPDTDFTVKLIDRYPPTTDYPRGFAMNLTDGILRARYRASWEKPTLLAPGEIYEISIEPFPTGNLFKAGHRLRLDVSSSNFPHFDVNPNTGEPEGRSRCTRIATNRIFVDRDHPSHIVLPVIPL